MKHTEESLSAMNNFERSKALAELLGWEVISTNGIYHNIVVRKSQIERPCVFDCNNPSDVMPLVFEHGISIIKDHDAAQYYACSGFDDKAYDYAYKSNEVHDTNPLRAAACCLILVLQEKKQ